MPAEMRDLPQQKTHAETRGEIRQTVLILRLTRSERPLLLPDNMS